MVVCTKLYNQITHMANVRGFRDMNAPQNNRPNQDNYRNLNNAVIEDIPFMNTMKGDQRPPMQETIPYTLKIICCPDFKIFSSTFLFLVSIWTMYIVCLINGTSTENHQVLQVQNNVLIDFGAAKGNLVKDGQVYRLITASFLHVNLLHITMNSISILLFVSRFEKIYGWQTPLVLLVASITGFMLSVLCNQTDITAGASAAVFGVLGGFIAYLIINWTALQRFGPVRSTIACIIGIIVVFSLLFSVGSAIDGIAHIGGMIGGLLISLGVLPGMQQKSAVIKYFGLAGIVAMNMITFLVFYLT